MMLTKYDVAKRAVIGHKSGQAKIKEKKDDTEIAANQYLMQYQLGC